MRSPQGRTIVAVVLAGALITAGCSDDDGTVPVADVSPTTAHAADVWDPTVAERCGNIAEGFATIQWSDSVASIARWATAWQEHLDAAPAIDEERFPVAAVGDVGGYGETIDAARAALAEAIEASSAGDLDSATLAGERADDLLLQSQAMLLVAGSPCGEEPVPPTDSTMEVPLLGAWQVADGFDSIWVSKQFSNAVARVDPESGRVLATIDVGSTPVKLQPANGRMWVRTSDAYLAMDPATNTVTTTLAKTDVGPEANRSWAVDGALWICDGSRLHRYDPIEGTVVTTVDLDVECGQVYATSDLVVAWTYNEDDGESGASAAAFIDPATNAVVAETDLPVDVNVPVVTDDSIFFPGYGNSGAASVDRQSWTVTEHELDVRLGGSQSTTDGTFIYVPTADKLAIAVIDARSRQVVDKMEPLDVNSLVATEDGLWVVDNMFGYLHRYDLAT